MREGKWSRERCAALDTNAKRCRRFGVRWLKYHGDSEIYGYDGPEPVWVRVALCKQHSKKPRKPHA